MSRLTKDKAVIGGVYTSAVNNIASCKYKIIKMKKTVCWVEVVDSTLHNGTVYKGVKYNVFNDKNYNE